MRPSRRAFFTWVSASGISLGLSRLAAAEVPRFAARETLPGRPGWNPAANGAGRIDGAVKVTGSKLYASDFRAADLPGWPAETAHALLVRAADATHLYAGIDLARLSGGLKPSVVVTAEDLEKIGARVPEFYAGDLLCPVGKTPLYLGQPVALLIFDKFDAFDQARLALRDGAFLKFADDTGPVVMPNYGAFRFTRVAGPTPDAPDVYSPVQEGWVSPGRFQNTERPIWARLPIKEGAPYAKAATYGEEIRALLAANDPAMLVLDREFETQSVDPMFLEPECGLAWYDTARKSLEMVHRRPVALRGGRTRSRICSARPRRRSSPPPSTRSSPMSAVALAAAITRRSRFMSRWRRCFSPAGRCVSHMTAISSSRPASSATLSRCAPGSASIGRAAGSPHLPPTMCSTVAGW